MTPQDQAGPVLQLVRDYGEPLIATVWLLALLLAAVCGMAIEHFAPTCEPAAERAP